VATGSYSKRLRRLLKPDIHLQSDHLDQTPPVTLKTESAISEFINTTTPSSDDSHRRCPPSSSMKAMPGWSVTKMAVDISSSGSSPDMQGAGTYTEHSRPVHRHWNLQNSPSMAITNSTTNGLTKCVLKTPPQSHLASFVPDIPILHSYSVVCLLRLLTGIEKL
jgi:hypothetical protein